ncbi:hypothetical protein [Erythrobacter sp.]|uniref:hypothetical protein n=1 Tax=Erythrobacter sp. TaxID=1042 RepID=UPI00311FCC51
MGITIGDLEGSVEGTVQVSHQGMEAGIACLPLDELAFDPFKGERFFFGEGHGFSMVLGASVGEAQGQT